MTGNNPTPTDLTPEGVDYLIGNVDVPVLHTWLNPADPPERWRAIIEAAHARYAAEPINGRPRLIFGFLFPSDAHPREIGTAMRRLGEMLTDKAETRTRDATPGPTP